MSQPVGFSWVKKPLLAGLARPSSLDDMEWLRDAGIELLLSLTEHPPRRDWTNDAGLMVFHEPIEDMTAPSLEQLERCISVIQQATEQNRGVAVHCAAGMGRTGVVLAAWLVSQGKSAAEAISLIRSLRPGSIETPDQEACIQDLAKYLSQKSPDHSE